MNDHVYKTIEITGSSPNGIEPAIQAAVTRASESLHDLRWFQVTEIRGHLDNADIQHWQVSLKIGFTLDNNTA